MITIYHNSNCSKCRETLEILKNSGKDFIAVEYLITPPSEELLDSLLDQLNMEPEELVRKNEDEFEAIEKSEKVAKTRSEWVKLMTNFPILIQRPIVSDGISAVIGRPPSKVLAWLNR